MRALLATTAVLLPTMLAAELPGQKGKRRNVDLMAEFDPGGRFSDVWGYHDAARGKEYALLFRTDGVFVMDCTDPKRPVQRGFFPGSTSGWSASRWMDGRVYRHYAYVVTEGGGGAKVIDLRDPDRPKEVKTITLSGWRNTHNVCIDTQRGVLYTAGARGGMRALDLTRDPLNPRVIANYTSAYVHDLQVQDGLGHFCEYYTNTYRIVDITRLPAFRSVGTARVLNCHNAWPTRDNRYAVTTSERFPGGLTVLDIRNKSRPVQIATYFRGGNNVTIHNAYMKDRLCHIAHNSEGYGCLDLSDPAKPVQVGFYDTSDTTSGFAGDWGCYAFQPSGTIYASDRTEGLQILKPKASAARYGKATASRSGKAPALFPFGAAWLGNANFKLQVEDARPTSLALFVFGAKRTNLNASGLTILVDIITTPGFVLTAPTDASGNATLPVPVPNESKLRGAVLQTQAFVVDPGASGLGLSGTRGLTFEVFGL